MDLPKRQMERSYRAGAKMADSDLSDDEIESNFHEWYSRHEDVSEVIERELLEAWAREDWGVGVSDDIRPALLELINDWKDDMPSDPYAWSVRLDQIEELIQND